MASGSRKSVEDLEAEAAAWAAKLDAAPGQAVPGLDDWFAQDPRHAGALLRAQAILAAFAPVAEIVPEPQVAPRRWVRWAAAGVGPACALAGVLLLRTPAQTYATDIGEVRSIALSDGSTIAIDAKSRIDVRFDASRRDIDLRAGKVLFRATHNAQRPFRVLLDGIVVTDIGTAFQVTRDDQAQSVEVLVTEGAVRVDSAAGALDLKAGQGARFSQAGSDRPALFRATPADIDRRLAWRDRELDLDGETLDSAVAEINRHSRIQLRVGTAALGQEKLYGSFRMDDASGFARTVAVGLGTDVATEPDAIVIGPAKK